MTTFSDEDLPSEVRFWASACSPSGALGPDPDRSMYLPLKERDQDNPDHWPFSPRAVREWLLDKPQDPIRDALIATIDALSEIPGVQGAEIWSCGPRPGTWTDGVYARSHAAFYALEAYVRPAMIADGVER